MRAEDLRRQLRATLAVAYGEGLLSEGTFAHRLDQLAANRVIKPEHLIGDLTLRDSRRPLRPQTGLAELIANLWRPSRRPTASPPEFLALDWTGTTEALLLGRHSDCDVTVDDLTVSRRHAKLIFRDGCWILHDLGSKNGTILNGALVTRCQLRPGDRLSLGEHDLVVD